MAEERQKVSRVGGGIDAYKESVKKTKEIWQAGLGV